MVAQCHLDGVPFDWPQHAILCERWQQDLTVAEQVLEQQIGTINPRSTKQLGDWLGQSLDVATLAAWPRTVTASCGSIVMCSLPTPRIRCWDRWHRSAPCTSS